MTEPKPQKAHSDACEHMPGATISMEEIRIAAYRKKKTKRLQKETKRIQAIRSTLEKIADKIGLEDIRQYPFDLLEWLHLHWTDPDMSDVPFESWSRKWIPAIKFAQGYNDSQHLTHDRLDMTTLQVESDPGDGIGILLLAKHYNYPYKNHENGKLIRIHAKEDGSVKGLQQLDVNYEEIATAHLLIWYKFKIEPILKFFGEPFKTLTANQLACIVGDAIEAHPDWLPNIVKAISQTSIKGYTNEMHKALERRTDELWGLKKLVDAVQEAHEDTSYPQFKIPEYKHGI